MADKIKAQVQLPLFGYRLFYRDPMFDLDELDEVAAKAAFLAFRQWNISLENVTFKENAANLAEEATNLSLLGGRITFSLNPGGCGILVVNPDWSEADLVIQIARAGIEAVLKATKAVADKQVASITMHLTPQTGTIGDITSKFVRLDMNKLIGASALCFGFSVYRDDLMWVVDKSVSFQNSLFVRLDRSFRGGDPLEDITHQLKDDESKLLDLLGLEVD